VNTDVCFRGVVALGLLGCESNPLPLTPPAPPAPRPVAITNAGRGWRQGTLDEPLEGLAVRVVDSAGHGVANVSVEWVVDSGAGTIQYGEQTRTDSAGTSGVGFRPVSAGKSRILAKVDGLQGSPVRFRAYVDGANLVFIPFGAETDCTEATPSTFMLISPVHAGARVEFDFLDGSGEACRGRVRSLAVPPGADPFDSGVLTQGQSFSVTFGAVGDWEFEDAINGGTGKVAVKSAAFRGRR
jgi:Bacterial Ig-like domain (group 1)